MHIGNWKTFCMKAVLSNLLTNNLEGMFCHEVINRNFYLYFEPNPVIVTASVVVVVEEVRVQLPHHPINTLIRRVYSTCPRKRTGFLSVTLCIPSCMCSSPPRSPSGSGAGPNSLDGLCWKSPDTVQGLHKSAEWLRWSINTWWIAPCGENGHIRNSKETKAVWLQLRVLQ